LPSSTGFSTGSKEKIPLGSSFASIITVATPPLKITVSPKKRGINFIKTGVRNGGHYKMKVLPSHTNCFYVNKDMNSDKTTGKKQYSRSSVIGKTE